MAGFRPARSKSALVTSLPSPNASTLQGDLNLLEFAGRVLTEARREWPTTS